MSSVGKDPNDVSLQGRVQRPWTAWLSQSLSCALKLDGAYAFTQLGEHSTCGAKLGRGNERHLESVRHRAIGPKEVERARRTQLAPGQ